MKMKMKTNSSFENVIVTKGLTNKMTFEVT